MTRKPLKRNELERMDKNELFKCSGLGGTIDTALPQSFFDKENEDHPDVHPWSQWVWWYPPGEGCCGEPLSLRTLISMVASGYHLSIAECELAEDGLQASMDGYTKVVSHTEGEDDALVKEVHTTALATLASIETLLTKLDTALPCKVDMESEVAA